MSKVHYSGTLVKNNVETLLKFQKKAETSKSVKLGVHKDGRFYTSGGSKSLWSIFSAKKMPKKDQNPKAIATAYGKTLRALDKLKNEQAAKRACEKTYGIGTTRVNVGSNHMSRKDKKLAKKCVALIASNKAKGLVKDSASKELRQMEKAVRQVVGKRLKAKVHTTTKQQISSVAKLKKDARKVKKDGSVNITLRDRHDKKIVSFVKEAGNRSFFIST